MNWYALVQRAFKRIGFEIHRSHPESEYTGRPCPRVVYAPWFGADFMRKYEDISEATWVSPDRCYVLYELALHCARLGGHFAECGVYRGGTAKLIASAIQALRQPSASTGLHLFDSFRGMPHEASVEGGIHSEGQFGDVNVQDVRLLLSAFEFVHYHVGWLPETLSETHHEATFALVHLDLDLAETTQGCLQFFVERMEKGGFTVIDDYGFPSYKDTLRAAVDAFFQGRDERPIALPTGQCIVPFT